MQVEYFSLVPSANGECVKLLSENMLQSSAVAAATAIQGLGAHASSVDEPQPKVKVCTNVVADLLIFCTLPHAQAPRSRTWTKEADAAIVDLVAEYGPKHWSQIAAHVPGRSGKQCRERSSADCRVPRPDNVDCLQVATSPKPRYKKRDVVARGRHDLDRCTQNIWKPLGSDCEASSWKVIYA